MIDKVYILIGLIFHDNSNKVLEASLNKETIENLREKCREFNDNSPKIIDRLEPEFYKSDDAYTAPKVSMDRAARIDEWEKEIEEYKKKSPVNECIIYNDFEIKEYNLI